MNCGKMAKNDNILQRSKNMGNVATSLFLPPIR